MRPSWDEYFMRIALQVATRSTCDRKHVGAVIVRDKTVLSTGYNGSIRGMPHCDDVGHMMENGHCIATVHAEANAIIQAARNGTAIDKADIYVTASPCWNCFQLIANSGIKRIFYLEFCRDEEILMVAREVGIELQQILLTATNTEIKNALRMAHRREGGPDHVHMCPTVTSWADSVGEGAHGNVLYYNDDFGSTHTVPIDG